MGGVALLVLVIGASTAIVERPPVGRTIASFPRMVAPTAGARLPLGVSTILSADESQEPPEDLRCRWKLDAAGRARPLSLPQDEGPQKDSFSISNCSLNVRFGEIEGIRPGAHLLSLETVLNHDHDGIASTPSRKTVPVTLVAGGFSAVGVAPGVALPGDPNVVLYGEGFDQRTQVRLAGPVYSLESPQKPLCELARRRCPETPLAAAVGPGGTSLRVRLPSSLAPGLYRIAARRGRDFATRWLTVEAVRKIIPPPRIDQHRRALPVYSGQTLQGTLRPRGDPSGVFWDYNLFYFVATAGSVIDVSLSRVETTKPWEHPDELDPELYIVAPDGAVLDDLWNADSGPGFDLNASVTGGRLARAGLHLIIAATTKGGGKYELRFVNHPGPACASRDQFASLVGHEPFSINLKFPFPSVAAMLDPLGRPLGDAPVNFRPVPGEGWRPEFPFEAGIGFVGGAGTRTNFRGLAAVRALLVGDGTVENAPFLPDPVLVATFQGDNPPRSPHARRGLVAAVSYLVRQVDLVTGEISLNPYDFNKTRP